MTSFEILVLQRGWVIVGDVTRTEGSDEVVVENASVIRRWGTIKGLGELAQGGPTESTKLDAAGTVKVHKLGVVLAMVSDKSKWPC